MNKRLKIKKLQKGGLLDIDPHNIKSQKEYLQEHLNNLYSPKNNLGIPVIGEDTVFMRRADSISRSQIYSDKGFGDWSKKVHVLPKLYLEDKTESFDNGGKVNRTGYLKDSKTKDNDVNIIPSSNITTNGMAFPIFANGKLLMPDTGDYKFDSNYVVETPALNKGGQMKKGKLKPKKMQDGGVTTSGALGAAGEAVSLLSPKAQYTSTEAPTLGLGDVAAGAKAGMAFGPIGAGVGAGLGLAKDIYDYQQDHKQFLQNVTNSRNENKHMYDATHKPYGERGYMQANPNKTAYSLFEGGGVGENPEMRNLSTVIVNEQSNGSVSLSKQEGGHVSDDLNELFDRAMEESGGDEEKAEKLVMAHAQNPDMKHNKKSAKLKKK